MSAGTVTTGLVWSTRVTVTLKEAVPVLPCASVAEQVTVVWPIGKLDPEAWSQLGVIDPSTLSFADTENVTEVPAGFSLSTEKSAGTVTTGFVVSTRLTVTVKEAVPVLPCASVAEQLTVVGPTAKFDPDAGEQVGVSGPSMMSVADAEP